MVDHNEGQDMPKEERERLVLSFLAEREVMLKPRALYDNLKYYEGITFGYKTVHRYLESFERRGLVEQTEEYGYYRITDKGRKLLDGEIEADNLEPDE